MYGRTNTVRIGSDPSDTSMVASLLSTFLPHSAAPKIQTLINQTVCSVAPLKLLVVASGFSAGMLKFERGQNAKNVKKYRKTFN